ncbi:acylneuraminate cytidylyltransferase family protein [Viridibacillus arvi]|uniref:acylneuraminate cytidylyltransferase family protein n=1 Tax=Viridibacillus arvi TaxID=263475 RepID=UPI0036ECDDB1
MKPTFLAVIPARGGSKGIPRKNIKELAGKPLIAWTIEEAKKSKYITRLILSSEDQEIIQVAEEYGCEVPFVRPYELARDTTSGMEPILHAIAQCPGYDYIIMLQPTSPLRTVEDIDNAIEKLLENDSNYCVSVVETSESPYWMYKMSEEKVLQPLLADEPIAVRRQELPVTYSLNGAIYIGKTKVFQESKSFLNNDTVGYLMSKEHSYDIDSMLDFIICDTLKKM